MPLWPFRGERRPGTADGSAGEGADLFGDIVETLADPLLVVRGEPEAHRIVFANAAARSFFRITAEDPLLVTAIRRPEVLEAVEHCLATGQAGKVSFELPDQAFCALTRALPPAGDGLPLALVVIRDETEVRQTERMRSDFMANASHELRTPLASIAGFIETLRGHAKEDPAARERFLEIMAGQAERMGRLIADLMSLSRIELNERVPPESEVDVDVVVRDVVDALGPIASRGGVALEAITSDAGARVTGDRDQLVQVVQNLVDNALKYSSPGLAVAVEVHSARAVDEILALRDEQATRMSLATPDLDPEERFVSIRIADQGPGVPREQLPRLSERFYRAPGQSSDLGGTGLGLAIVKHIVQRHRGGLAVESAPGRGAAFTVYLPARLSGPAVIKPS